MSVHLETNPSCGYDSSQKEYGAFIFEYLSCTNYNTVYTLMIQMSYVKIPVLSKFYQQSILINWKIFNMLKNIQGIAYKHDQTLVPNKCIKTLAETSYALKKIDENRSR